LIDGVPVDQLGQHDERMVRIEVFQQGEILPMWQSWLFQMMTRVHVGLIKICKKTPMTPAEPCKFPTLISSRRSYGGAVKAIFQHGLFMSMPGLLRFSHLILSKTENMVSGLESGLD
jgi:hypothetical protein